MAWIESHQELGAHPKTRKLARLLAISRPAAVGHLQFLWWWALDYAQDGDLSQFELIDLAVAGEWEGDPQVFVDALLGAGFINADMSIHDWDIYAGRWVHERLRNAEKQRRWRERQKGENEASNEGDEARNRNVTVTKPSHNRATVPNLTKPNLTTPPLPPKPNGATAPPAADYRSLIGDDYWSALDAFKKIDPALSNGWLDKALKRAPPGLSPDRLFQALENALNRVGEDFHRNETQQFIKSKYGWANTIVDEEFADAQRTTP